MGNLLDNGGFDGNLDEWSGTGTILRADGYPRLGCVQLATGQSIGQREDVGSDQLYTLHYFYKLASNVTLMAGYGSVTQSHVYNANAGIWYEGVLSFALDANASDSVQFAASGGAASVDSVTLLMGALPISRAQIGARVARRLGTLATDQSLTTTASAAGSEGSYTDAIDEALRQIGAVNVYGDPDVTRVSPEQVNSVIEAAVQSMLELLRMAYSLKTDVSLGPRKESFSQIAGSLDKMLSGGPAPVAVRRLRHRAEDFEL